MDPQGVAQQHASPLPHPCDAPFQCAVVVQHGAHVRVPPLDRDGHEEHRVRLCDLDQEGRVLGPDEGDRPGERPIPDVRDREPDLDQRDLLHQIQIRIEILGRIPKYVCYQAYPSSNAIPHMQLLTILADAPPMARNLRNPSPGRITPVDQPYEL